MYWIVNIWIDIHSLPWDQTTFAGYLAEMCLSIPFAAWYYLLKGVSILFFISLCYHHEAFYKILQRSVHILNTVNNYRDQKILLCNIIRFHNSAKRWWLWSNWNFICFLQLMWCFNSWFLFTTKMYNTFVMVDLIIRYENWNNNNILCKSDRFWCFIFVFFIHDNCFGKYVAVVGFNILYGSGNHFK